MLDALVSYLKPSSGYPLCYRLRLPYQLVCGHGPVCTKEEMLPGFCGANDKNE